MSVGDHGRIRSGRMKLSARRQQQVRARNQLGPCKGIWLSDDWHSGGISQLFLRLADATVKPSRCSSDGLTRVVMQRDDHKDDCEELVEVHVRTDAHIADEACL